MQCRASHRLAILLGGGAAATAAFLVLRKRMRQIWNATSKEAARPMLLDEEISNPTYVTNRAITIRARREAVWPWIAQMGDLPRGGYYSYVAVERLLGMTVANADRILTEFQDPKVGDVLDARGTMIVKAVEPGKVLVLGPPAMPGFRTTWALGLFPAGRGVTRLISRCRVRLPRGLRGLLIRAILGAGQLPMERKMLLEIKKRAERTRVGPRIKRAPRSRVPGKTTSARRAAPERAAS